MSVRTAPTRPTGHGKRTRARQRTAHLVTGALLLLYVYAPGPPDAMLQTVIRWVALPLLVITGLLMWQWPRLRRLVRARPGRPEGHRTTTSTH
jgi:protein-S-isoprenylcysteine O-methyltransferase Ste14